MSNRKTDTTVPDVATAVGLTTCLIGLATPLAPFALLGIPAIITARIFRAQRDKQQRRGRNIRKEDKAMVPNTYPLVPRASCDLYDFNSPQLNAFMPLKDPITAIAEQSPKLAYDALISQSLAKTHKEIVARPAHEFAKQGKGMIATTTRKKGFFFDSESITTAIRPL